MLALCTHDTPTWLKDDCSQQQNSCRWCPIDARKRQATRRGTIDASSEAARPCWMCEYALSADASACTLDRLTRERRITHLVRELRIGAAMIGVIACRFPCQRTGSRDGRATADIQILGPNERRSSDCHGILCHHRCRGNDLGILHRIELSLTVTRRILLIFIT